MSKDLNLHYSSLNYMSMRASNLENLKEIIKNPSTAKQAKSGGATGGVFDAKGLKKMIQSYH